MQNKLQLPEPREERNTQRRGITQEPGSSAGDATAKLFALQSGQPGALPTGILRDAPHSNKPASVKAPPFALYFVCSLSPSHTLETAMPCSSAKSQGTFSMLIRQYTR